MEITTTTKKVPFFNYPFVYQQHETELSEIVNDIVNKGAFILQQDLSRFEQSLANFLNAEYAVGVGNCTDGLQLALMAAGIGENDEVIFSSHTFVATAAAIHFAGATPVPVECGKDHLIDADAIEAAITSRTKAIMPTQLNGFICDMDKISKIAEKHGLLIIEDAAQSLGATYKGKSAGTFGLASAFSFYPAKVVGCFGDGGGVVTNDENLYNQVNLLRDHGRNSEGDTVIWGMNSRLDNLQAAVLDFKLSKYHLDIEKRRSLAGLYNQYLGDIAELNLPEAPNSDPEKYNVYQNYEIEAQDRDRLRTYLSENGIGSILQWGGKAVHQFEKLGLKTSLPFTEELMKKMFLLPMNTSLSDDDISYICDKIRKFYGY